VWRPACVYQANAVGRNSKTLREFLEKHYEENLKEDEAVDLALKTLLEVVESGANSIELMVLKKGAALEVRVGRVCCVASFICMCDDHRRLRHV